MQADISQLKKRINNCPLPILQSTAQFFSRQKLKRGASISGLWQQLQYDPGMCLNLLRAAGRSRRARVTTVGHAILLLGLPNALSRADSLPIVEDIKNSSIRQHLLQLFSHAHFAARQSELWIHPDLPNGKEEILTASLMTGFIDYLLCNAEPGLYRKLVHSERIGQSRAEAEQQMLGVSRRELALTIAKEWRLPDLLTASLQHNGQQAYNIELVYLIQRLLEEMKNGWYHDGMLAVLEEIALFQHQELSQTVRQLHKTAAAVSRTSHTMYYPAVGLAAALIEHPATTIRQAAVPIKPKKTRKQILQSAIHALQHRSDLNYQEILNWTFYGFRNGLGLQRMFFALKTEEQQHLAVKYASDTNNHQQLDRLRLPLDHNTLFEKLMRKPAAVWVNSDNLKTYLPMLPKTFINEIDSRAFLAMSVFLHDKPVAMLFADSPKSDAFTENHFKYFKRLCRVATEALEALSDRQQRPKIAQA